jgi:unsaturated rhamnogalacturonyl hydrolase
LILVRHHHLLYLSSHMKRNKNILFVLLIVVFAGTTKIQAQSWSEKMAATVMSIWKDSLYSDPARPAKWTYDQGVILKGIEGLWYRTGDPKYFAYMQKCMDFFVNDKGDIRTYKQSDFNLDNVLCGRILLTLYNVTGKEKYIKAAAILREQLKAQPRTNQGGFWHKKIYPYQMWLDGLYMAEGFYAEFAATYNEPAAFDDIAHQFIEMEKHARDPKTGLLYHGWDESKQQKWANKQTGLSPHFWARAMAWYGMALVDVLENFPPENKKRDSVLAILKRFADAVKKVQDPATGLWYDIINLPKEKGNYLEASASSMFVCAIAKAVRLGFLPASYLDVSKKGYPGILKTFIETDANGQTNLKGTVSVSGLGGNPYRDGSYTYYMSEKVIVNDPKGIGAFLQAANEMELLSTLSKGKGKTVLLDDYFNSEKKKDFIGNLKPYHYKWYEMYNNGFSFLGHVFNSYGVQTKTLSEAPTVSKLKATDIYLIVDADNLADNPTPNYVQPKDADEVYNWVKAGGVLVLLHNDKGNAEFEHFNTLSDKFGIHFNEDSYNKVVGNDYTGGKIDIPAGNPILPNEKKIYQKEVSSISVKSPAVAVLKKDDLIIFAVAKVGKGTVFATGDPWLYNEYTDGRKLPLEYENFKAANDLVSWLIKQIPVKAIKKK